MAKKKKPRAKLGALGPAAHWLDMSIAQRAKTKQYIKESFSGYTRADGVAIPGARRIFKGMSAADGYDLRHIERWSAARLKHARQVAQTVNTFTGRPFVLVTPRTKSQRKAAQTFTGQNLPNQKTMVIAVQDAKHDAAKFKNNQVVIEREYKGGSKTIEQRYLFRKYLEPGEAMPITFSQMRQVTQRMLPDMPEKYRGEWVYYTLLTVQYGSIGQSVPKTKIMDLLADYHQRYDATGQHRGFAEAVLGFNMVGTYKSAAAYQMLREQLPAKRKKMKKLAFSKEMQKSVNRCGVWKGSKRCTKKANHKGDHKF